jgi:hypothetical protein
MGPHTPDNVVSFGTEQGGGRCWFCKHACYKDKASIDVSAAVLVPDSAEVSCLGLVIY